jgi:oligopeptide transport system substrate-binding protein
VRRTTVLLCALALAISSCDGGLTNDATSGSTASPGQTPDTGEGPSPTESPIFEPGAEVLEVAVTEPATLDPMRIGDPGSVLVARSIYESLTGWDASEEDVFPAAAESWEIKDGGRRFIFHLRPGTTFHDGSPVRSADFVFAFNRIAQKRNGSALAYLLERVAGFHQVNRLGSRKEMRGLRAKDELTLEVELSEPYIDLPALMTHPGLVPLPKRAVKEIDAFLRRPVGNGPFEMARPWSPGQPIVLQRFAGFIRTPPLDGVRFIPFPDAASSWLDFVAGEFDVAEVPADQIRAASEAYGEQGYQPLLAGYYFGFNIDSGALKKRKLREAISRGIDRDFIVRDVYKGTMDPPRGIVPAGMPGFQSDVCGELCEYDPDAAARLVRELPRSDRKVTIDYTRGRLHKQVAGAVKDDLEEIGLRVDVNPFPFDKYLKRLRKGDQEMYRLGWIGEYPAPDSFLTALFDSNAPDNHSGFASGKVDRIMRRARAEPSRSRRQRLYARAEKLIMDRAPITPIGTFITHWAAQPHVEGLRFDLTGGFDAFDVSLSEDARSGGGG